MHYVIRHEGRGKGWTVWSVGLSGSLRDCLAHHSSKRAAEAHARRLNHN